MADDGDGRNRSLTVLPTNPCRRRSPILPGGHPYRITDDTQITIPAPTPLAIRPFVEYMCDVNRLLHEYYGMMVDILDAVATAREAGESPDEHAEWLAKHYDWRSLHG